MLARRVKSTLRSGGGLYWINGAGGVKRVAKGKDGFIRLAQVLPRFSRTFYGYAADNDFVVGTGDEIRKYAQGGGLSDPSQTLVIPPYLDAVYLLRDRFVGRNPSAKNYGFYSWTGESLGPTGIPYNDSYFWDTGPGSWGIALASVLGGVKHWEGRYMENPSLAGSNNDGKLTIRSPGYNSGNRDYVGFRIDAEARPIPFPQDSILFAAVPGAETAPLFARYANVVLAPVWDGQDMWVLARCEGLELRWNGAVVAGAGTMSFSRRVTMSLYTVTADANLERVKTVYSASSWRPFDTYPVAGDISGTFVIDFSGEAIVNPGVNEDDGYNYLGLGSPNNSPKADMGTIWWYDSIATPEGSRHGAFKMNARDASQAEPLTLPYTGFVRNINVLPKENILLVQGFLTFVPVSPVFEIESRDSGATWKDRPDSSANGALPLYPRQPPPSEDEEE
jgi:hypothetical protein